MSFKITLVAAALLATPLAADIMVIEPYALASSPVAKAGAAFMVLHNNGDTDDRLIGVSSTVAKRTELHTHKDQGGGVMKMVHVEEGFVIPAGEKLMLKRGGNHIMFLGLNNSLDQGETVSVTLTFETAGDVVLDVPVDLKRKPKAHGHSDH
jgi:copper(I)-binding protein